MPRYSALPRNLNASILGERVLTLREVARRYDLHERTVRKWMAPGLQGGAVQLEVTRGTTGWVTSEEALLRFQRRLNPDECIPATVPASYYPSR